MTDLERREIWHQLPTESESAYSHFRGYLAQERGRRSIRVLAESLGMSPATLSELSARHQWVARVQGHDAHIDAIEEQEFEAERRRIARDAARAAGRALNASQLAIQASVLGLQQYVKPGRVDEHGIARDETGAPVYRLDPDQSLAALRAGTRAAVAAHQLVADRVTPGDVPDDLPVEEMAYGLTVWDLADSLMRLAGSPPPDQQPAAPDPGPAPIDTTAVDTTAPVE